MVNVFADAAPMASVKQVKYIARFLVHVNRFMFMVNFPRKPCGLDVGKVTRNCQRGWPWKQAPVDGSTHFALVIAFVITQVNAVALAAYTRGVSVEKIARTFAA
jgi:hypothetical protein